MNPKSQKITEKRNIKTNLIKLIKIMSIPIKKGIRKYQMIHRIMIQNPNKKMQKRKEKIVFQIRLYHQIHPSLHKEAKKDINRA